MKNIIVPVDFTETSNNAARYAADLAAFIGAELHLVHVLDYKALIRKSPCLTMSWMRSGITALPAWTSWSAS